MSETKVPKDVDEYKKHYSDNGFWNKVKSLGKKVLKPVMLKDFPGCIRWSPSLVGRF